MADISRLELIEAATLDDINALLKQLSERVPACTLELLQNIVTSPAVELWVARESGSIVGMGELAITLKPEGVLAQIDFRETNRASSRSRRTRCTPLEQSIAQCRQHAISKTRI